MKIILTLVCGLFFLSCSPQYTPFAIHNASPELLREKLNSDPQNAYRYVSRQNANMVLDKGENYTILHAAAFARNFELVRALVENGADPGVRARWPYDSGGYSDYIRTPATTALMWNRLDIARYLTDRSGENLDQLVAESNAIVRRAHAEARVEGFRLIKDVIEFDNSLPEN